jgi:hypothetical protein
LTAGALVGLLVGGCAGLGVGIHVGFAVLVPLTMLKDTRYKVPICPLTLAVTVWVPAWRFAHRSYDRPPQRV